jgi:hypothetical protein
VGTATDQPHHAETEPDALSRTAGLDQHVFIDGDKDLAIRLRP